MTDLIEKVLAGDARAIARLITLSENNAAGAVPIMKQLHSHTGNAHVIGVTGVMGSGKSSLIFELALEYRRQGKKVGIIAIDPTSPFTGGALLGDRIRMMDLSTDSGVFIRSMGTRGTIGGLTSSVYDVVEILDAAGMQVILIETVGVGQDEVDIVKIADTTLVVTMPGLGDAVQTIKAGLMEIADIFVVNKADTPGVEQTVAELEAMLDLAAHIERRTPIISTSAKEKKGIPLLIRNITEHKEYLIRSKGHEARRRQRYEAELIEIIRKRLMDLILDETRLKGVVDCCIDQISRRELDPYTAADQILGKILK
ncbi:MAG TPA: methylmalonyl Co-A mutase-associated GTPase MeaB [Candidatus Thermoplasmatota archaeon]|nr:methylmalonyl Co-A mutase-associated GTPase MeaB [Candidatus Thermoplasmatota archaeon]